MLRFFSLRKDSDTVEDRPTFVAVGYPKVGNTWVRVTLGRYVQRFAGLHDIPLFEPGDSALLSRALGPAAAGYFTHAPLEWSTQTATDLNHENVVRPFQGKKVILLVRHPLDALVSLYKQTVYRVKPKPFSGDLVQFIEDPVYGLNKIIVFYELWRDSVDRESVLLWRYEDARLDMASSLRQILTFLQLPIVEELISDATTYGSFDNMKAMEKSEVPLRYRSSGFQIFASGDLSNPDAFHVRKGEVGAFRGELRREDADRFEAIVRNHLSSRYGYC
jgi:Sulfotransferase domain